MYNIEEYELGMASIVFILYIVGKVWMYYKIEQTNDNETNDK
jgi:hypothetical protein